MNDNLENNLKRKISLSEAGRKGALANKNITNWLKRQERIVNYYLTASLCKWCKKPISYKDRDKKYFCCRTCFLNYIHEFGHSYHSCKQEIKRQKYTYKCLNCGKICNSFGNKRNKFCSVDCCSTYKRNNAVKDIERDEIVTNGRLRNYLFRKFKRCMNPCCGWNWDLNSKVVLELHHKDGNYRNSRLSNVTLLCPNCHSLTETYKARNKGHGRLNRLKLFIPKNVIDNYLNKNAS